MAATGIVSGINGNLTYATGYATKVTAWTLRIAAAVVDTTALGDTWRTRISGLREWDGSITALLNSSNLAGTVGALAIGEAPAAASLIFDNNASTKGVFHGTMMIGEVTINPAVGDQATTMSFNFFGSSTLSVQAAA